jgi:hypothetical protein
MLGELAVMVSDTKLSCILAVKAITWSDICAIALSSSCHDFSMLGVI